MNIVRLILDNLRCGALSFRRPHTHICTSSQYRGLVHNDPDRCVGCASCAYVCPTAAIQVTRSGEHYQWAYDPGKCTFCGRCIDRCRLNTLSMESKLPPLYHSQGELRQVLHMVRRRPIRPATAVVAAPAVPERARVAAEAAAPEPVA